MIFEGGIYSVAIPFGRSLAGFLIGAMLGILGGWTSVIFITLIPALNGMPDLAVGNVYIVSIGIGAGLGAYFTWANWATNWYYIAGSVILVMLGGIAGGYIGIEIGQSIKPSYLGRAHTVEGALHYGAPLGAAFVSTIVGLYNEIHSHHR
jgi:uncharacterized membrane protein YfcA